MVVQMDNTQVTVNKTDMIEAKIRVSRILGSMLSTDSLLKIGILAGYYGDTPRKEMDVNTQDWVNFLDILKERNALILADVDKLEMNLPGYLEMEENKDSEIAA